jgi:hypothetical protein
MYLTTMKQTETMLCEGQERWVDSVLGIYRGGAGREHRPRIYPTPHRSTAPCVTLPLFTHALSAPSHRRPSPGVAVAPAHPSPHSCARWRLRHCSVARFRDAAVQPGAGGCTRPRGSAWLTVPALSAVTPLTAQPGPVSC